MSRKPHIEIAPLRSFRERIEYDAAMETLAMHEIHIHECRYTLLKRCITPALLRSKFMQSPRDGRLMRKFGGASRALTYRNTTSRYHPTVAVLNREVRIALIIACIKYDTVLIDTHDLVFSDYTPCCPTFSNVLILKENLKLARLEKKIRRKLDKSYNK